MKRKWTIRIFAGLLVMTLLSGIGAYVVIRGAVVEMFGGETEVADAIVADAEPGITYITNANILAPTADSFVERQVVGIENGSIIFVGDETELPENAKTVDGRGMYLVPGFTDSHVHLWRSPNDLLLYVANGVTQVREMHGIDLHLQWKSEIEQGRLGPDLYIVAAQLATYDFFEGLWVDITAERNVVRSENDVQKTIKSLASDGFDAVKASSYLSLPGYQWASAAMPDQRVPLTGHIPMAATLDDLWASNQTEVAHVEEFVKALDREFGGYKIDSADEFLAFVHERKEEVAQRIIENDIYVTSTLGIIQSFAPQQTDLDKTLAGVALEYVNPGIAEGEAMGWLPATNRYRLADEYKTKGWEDRQRAYWSAYVEAQQILFGAFLEAGVPMMAGTDANVPVMVPGFSLHQEMKAMQEGGMSPAQVLASATTVPAKWMEWKGGQIRKGYDANLVLLRENPLVDIDATDSIEMVFVNGHVLDRSRLDALLQSVLSANEASRRVDLKQ